MAARDECRWCGRTARHPGLWQHETKCRKILRCQPCQWQAQRSVELLLHLHQQHRMPIGEAATVTQQVCEGVIRLDNLFCDEIEIQHSEDRNSEDTELDGDPHPDTTEPSPPPRSDDSSHTDIYDDENGENGEPAVDPAAIEEEEVLPSLAACDGGCKLSENLTMTLEYWRKWH